MNMLQSRCATESELLQCHSQSYIDRLKESSTMNKEQLMDLSQNYDGVYMHQVGTKIIHKCKEGTML